MYALTGSVGERAAKNNKADVAFIQLLLKVLKNRQGKPYFTGSISGNYKDAIIDGLIELSGDAGLPSRNNLFVRRHLTARVANKWFLPLLPDNYKKLRLHFDMRLARPLILVELPPQTASATGTFPRVAELGLPQPHKRRLVRILHRLAIKFRVVPRINKVRVDAQGRFVVNVALAGGLRINNRTGAIQPITNNSSTKKITRSLGDSPDGILGRDDALWTLIFKDELVFRTLDQFKHLRLNSTAKNLILRRLRYPGHKSPKDREAKETCFAAYELARIRQTLSDADKQQFMECFGADRDVILRMEAARRARCYQWNLRLQQLRRRGTTLARQARVVSGLLGDRRSENKEAVGELTATIAGTIAGKGLGSLAKQLGRPIASEVIEPGVGLATDALFETIDIWDLVFAGASPVITVFALGFGAAVSPYILVGLFAAEIGKSIYDFVQDRAELNEDIREFSLRLANLSSEVGANAKQIEAQMIAMKGEGCFQSIADFGFSPEELAEGGPMMRAYLKRLPR